MRLSRHYIDTPLQAGQFVDLPEACATHLVRVLRLGLGARLILFNGDGHDYEAELAEIGKKTARAEIRGRQVRDTESPLRLTLAQGVARGEKMDFVLQKATELGVSAIAPLHTERTEVRLDAERAQRRHAHWQGVIASACEQSGRARLPQLAALSTLPDWLASLDKNSPAPACFYLDPDADTCLQSLSGQVDLKQQGAAFVIGPEGGLGERDLAALRAARATGLRLGPRILRTETAGLALLAALQALHGDWS